MTDGNPDPMTEPADDAAAPVSVPVVIAPRPSPIVNAVALGLMVVAVIAALLPALESVQAWWWRPLGAVLGLAGGWLHGRGLGDRLRTILIVVTVALAALGGGLAWWWLAFAAAGIAGGYLCAWGYAHGRRGWWFSLALLVLVHVGTAVAGLVRLASGGTLWWSFTHGLITLALGAGLLLWSAGGSGPRRSLARKGGRLAIILALALPYIALALLGTR